MKDAYENKLVVSHRPGDHEHTLPPAGIEVMAYQMEASRKAHLLPRVDLFIVDDVGLGKTIEAGLIIRELTRRLSGAAILAPEGGSATGVIIRMVKTTLASHCATIRLVFLWRLVGSSLSAISDSSQVTHMRSHGKRGCSSSSVLESYRNH